MFWIIFVFLVSQVMLIKSPRAFCTIHFTAKTSVVVVTRSAQQAVLIALHELSFIFLSATPACGSILTGHLKISPSSRKQFASCRFLCEGYWLISFEQDKHSTNTFIQIITCCCGRTMARWKRTAMITAQKKVRRRSRQKGADGSGLVARVTSY